MVCLEMCYMNTFDLDLDLPMTVMFVMSFNPCVSKGNVLTCYKFGISGFRVELSFESKLKTGHRESLQ